MSKAIREKTSKKIFFQSSMPRSGSSLLQNIIFQRPDFYCTPTSGLLELVYAARENYSSSPEFKAQDKDEMKKAWLGFCKQGMHGYYDAITDKQFVLDKSRGWGIHYPFLKEIFSDEKPKVICMVRDLRDIICSMEKKFRANPERSMGIINWETLRGATTASRVDVWMASQPVGLAITRLAEMIKQNIDSEILFIKYEDLCLYPEAQMKKIYNYLEVDSFEHDFDNIKQVTKEDDEVYGIFGDHKIQTKLTPAHSQAKLILGQEVCNWIKNNYTWYFERFGYR